jgi:hypothetical protein
MKTVLISLAALAAVSTAALAERNYDISSPPVGEVIFGQKKNSNTDVRLLATPEANKVDRLVIDRGKNDSNSKNDSTK